MNFDAGTSLLYSLSPEMSFNPFSFRSCLTLSVLVIGAGFSAVQAADDEYRSIHFSEIKGQSGGTNLNSFTAQPAPGVNNLGGAIIKPDSPFNTDNSLNGVMGTMPQPITTVIPNRRSRDAADKKNWVFNAPEEMLGLNGTTPEEIFNLPKYGAHGEEKEETTALQRFSKRTFEKNRETEQFLRDGLFGSDNKHENSSFDNSNPDLKERKESDRALKKLFSTSSDQPVFSSGQKPANLLDIFGLNKSDATDEERLRYQKDQLDRLDQFKQVLDPQYQPPVNGGLNALLNPPPQAPSTPTVNNDFNSSPGQANIFNPTLGAATPSLTPRSLPDVNAQYLARPGVTPVFVAPAPANVAPPRPNFTAPRRNF